MDVYIAVVGQLVLAAGLVAWAVWRNRREHPEPPEPPDRPDPSDGG